MIRDVVDMVIRFRTEFAVECGAVVDATSRFMITASGNRGWFGESTRTVLVHEMKPVY